jgi:hypothetical protein
MGLANAYLYGSEIRSRRGTVFVNHTTKSIASLDITAAPFRDRWRCRPRRPQTQCPMGTMSVVMMNEDAKSMLEMLVIEDQQPVEALSVERCARTAPPSHSPAAHETVCE